MVTLGVVGEGGGRRREEEEERKKYFRTVATKPNCSVSPNSPSLSAQILSRLLALRGNRAALHLPNCASVRRSSRAVCPSPWLAPSAAPSRCTDYSMRRIYNTFRLCDLFRQAFATPFHLPPCLLSFSRIFFLFSPLVAPRALVIGLQGENFCHGHFNTDFMVREKYGVHNVWSKAGTTFQRCAAEIGHAGHVVPLPTPFRDFSSVQEQNAGNRRR